MAEYQIIIDNETMQRLFTGDNGLARLLEQALNQILEGRVRDQLGADRYERTEERQGYRNGAHPMSRIWSAARQ